MRMEGRPNQHLEGDSTMQGTARCLFIGMIIIAAPAALRGESGTAGPLEPEPGEAAGPADSSEKEPGLENDEKEKSKGPYTEKVEVQARADDLVGIATSATEGVTGREDLERRPRLRPGELVETVPGVIATQHSGGGKANQYFLRGFNLDHGTDFRVSVDGMQVNLPTHGHGQGYADLNFLIPELIDAARYRKGPYYADVGDFSAAGAVEFELASSLDENIVRLSGGEFGFRRALAAGSRQLAGGGALLGALDCSHYDGPWERPDDLERVNGLVRYGRDDAEGGFAVTLMGYEGEWDATDQIPRRAVEQGLVGRFGGLDPDLGGDSSRYSLSGQWHRFDGVARTEVSGFVETYDLELLSNFTYFLDDEIDGDQFLQKDDRTIVGARAAQQRWGSVGGRPARLGYGGEVRLDRIDNGLFETIGGAVSGTIREDGIDELGGGLFVDGEVQVSGWLKTAAGVRADWIRAEVDSDLDMNSGEEGDWIVSPKLSAVLGPWRKTEYYVNVGYGYHSNDARGATIRVDPGSGQPAEPVDLLVRARGADVGLRTAAAPGLQTTLSLFALELDSELLFIGDAGATEASRPSRRTGIEVTNFYRPVPWLSLDLDLALTGAEFTDQDPAGDQIPGAIEQAVAAGLAFHDLDGFSGSLRWRYFGPRPLIEDDSVRSGSTSLVDFSAGYRFANGLSVAVEVFNLLDRQDSDIEYFYASRLPGEPTGGIDDVHFHPMESRSARLSAAWEF
jgi:outer membrane receptor protein involved in Fe transport